MDEWVPKIPTKLIIVNIQRNTVFFISKPEMKVYNKRLNLGTAMFKEGKANAVQ